MEASNFFQNICPLSQNHHQEQTTTNVPESKIPKATGYLDKFLESVENQRKRWNTVRRTKAKDTSETIKLTGNWAENFLG